MGNIITLREYLAKGNEFIIPYYQRGYIWGKKNNSSLNSVEHILKTIENGLKDKSEIFLQGITVSEIKIDKKTNIELIDGQQRTTFFYLLLSYLGYEEPFNIEYEVRRESKDFLENQKTVLKSEKPKEPKEDVEFQDIYFFKKTLQEIDKEFTDIEKETLRDYVLDNIKFLYINIPKEKAIKTFTMMNGSKARMLPEELIKAEMLRQISLIDEKEMNVLMLYHNLEEIIQSIFEKEWETNALRSKYAREWDKWLYWWNREDVRYFFRVNNPMGLLLEYYIGLDKKEKDSFNFDNFRKKLSDKKSTKTHFKGLRDLQKSFEDIFNNPIIYNLLGVSLMNTQQEEKKEIIRLFIKKKKEISYLEEFTKWRVVGASYDEIVEQDKHKEKTEKAESALELLGAEVVYGSDGDGIARTYLLYLNVLEDNKANDQKGRKFNFQIFDKQSLEHIFPKSRVIHKDKDGVYWKGDGKSVSENEKDRINDGSWLEREEFSKVTEHSIGNLVLLESRDNSIFSNSTFNDKKKIYFNTNEIFRSRDLLHTMSVFANEKWGLDEIKENQGKILSKFTEVYGLIK